ncbi:hypothetical protein [Stenoxybacter acetivorans]|uniref:hypothetical protein n=1 Tax=Stenoxybacter acetivorans TaxID=422441 RepID=UPI000559D982|nr:hypothetical protein [Stenoxybacter acetivorans]
MKAQIHWFRSREMLPPAETAVLITYENKMLIDYLHAAEDGKLYFKQHCQNANRPFHWTFLPEEIQTLFLKDRPDFSPVNPVYRQLKRLHNPA